MAHIVSVFGDREVGELFDGLLRNVFSGGGADHLQDALRTGCSHNRHFDRLFDFWRHKDINVQNSLLHDVLNGSDVDHLRGGFKL
eukprot:CAMPEP_0194493090 /NCGR_PEP_ID=MMETSP0253-20130528/11412_1 /TAXON_ID=2966 /ORGANISM="Noctiluca scintillans" /LENGTH=84 /DNA_ID=CAMNT_0039334029 /DNA_START=178 /DNA_END=432 /DNA_ORIENTATION=-